MSESVEMPAKIRLMYYLWKKKGHRGTKRELAEELGYEDETTVLKHLKALEDMGYVTEDDRKGERIIRLTSKGNRRILFLTYHSLAIPTIVLFGLAYIALNISLHMGVELVPLGYAASGVLLIAFGILLYYNNKKIEKEIFSFKD